MNRVIPADVIKNFCAQSTSSTVGRATTEPPKKTEQKKLTFWDKVKQLCERGVSFIKRLWAKLAPIYALCSSAMKFYTFIRYRLTWNFPIARRGVQ